VVNNSQYIQLKTTQKLWHMWSWSLFFIFLRVPIIDYQLAKHKQTYDTLCRRRIGDNLILPTSIGRISILFGRAPWSRIQWSWEKLKELGLVDRTIPREVVAWVELTTRTCFFPKEITIYYIVVLLIEKKISRNLIREDRGGITCATIFGFFLIGYIVNY